MTEAEWIAAARQWANLNYERGADVFVECWEDQDFAQVWQHYQGHEEFAFEAMDRLRSIYAEQQADARYYQEHG